MKNVLTYSRETRNTLEVRAVSLLHICFQLNSGKIQIENIKPSCPIRIVKVGPSQGPLAFKPHAQGVLVYYMGLYGVKSG